MPLTTLTKLKIHLGIPLTDLSEDSLLEQLITEVDRVCSRFCRRDFTSVEATEYYDGSGREMLILKRRPVTAVAGVWVDGSGFYGQAPGGFPAESAWAVGVDFGSPSLDESEDNGGLLLAIRRHWPEGRGNVKVTYTAGYVEIPDDLTLAANQLAATLRSQSVNNLAGPLGSETFGEYSYTVLSGAAAAGTGLDVVQARSILARYREVAI